VTDGREGLGGMGALFILSLKADAGIKKYIKMQGEEESVKIMAQTDKDKTILLADSYMEAEKTKGEGDAEALKIYAQAYEKDPEFYSFSPDSGSLRQFARRRYNHRFARRFGIF
jgi:hypothetical protein